jgi:hypothetical protein
MAYLNIAIWHWISVPLHELIKSLPTNHIHYEMPVCERVPKTFVVQITRADVQNV